ncbi:MAG: TlyA family RNA methyltransferase [Rhodobacteraceae bacterium]|nr:MAG: TlyA family RNA methyltransferase [Paracoccaceae bacterium]
MRLDQRLVALGLARSRAEARALIEAGAVSVDGAAATKPAQAAPEGAAVSVAPVVRWASRGALKLLHALDVFGLDPTGAAALDVGASTGGFTDALLARGAARVTAVDVGHGQLLPRLAADPRVTSLEGVNARSLPADLGPFDWIVADLSFVSLEKGLAPALERAAPGATLVALIKPQFEAGRAAVGKGGLVRDAAVHAAVRARVRAWLEGLGWRVVGEAESPIAGGDGAREFLIAARRGGRSPEKTAPASAPD